MGLLLMLIEVGSEFERKKVEVISEHRLFIFHVKLDLIKWASVEPETVLHDPGVYFVSLFYLKIER